MVKTYPFHGYYYQFDSENGVHRHNLKLFAGVERI